MQASANLSFFPTRLVSETLESRIETFVAWARPFGNAGFNAYHSENYDSRAPYFDWSSKVFAQNDSSTRSWFIKQECLGEGRSIFSRARKGTTPKIKNSDALISSEDFLVFSKAYINVVCHYRDIRSVPKALVSALCYVEKALRDLNSGASSPIKINSKVLDRAAAAVNNSLVNQGSKYDIGKELEIMAGMLQDGYKSKTFRFQNKGFFLLPHPFAFASPIRSRPRRRSLTLNSEELTAAPPRLTSEHVAAVGLAYRKSVDLFGENSLATFFGAIAGLSFTTVSMRRSDLLVLRRDAVYRSQDPPGRCRIRISRPKVDIHQDLPIPNKLSDLAEELFQRVLTFTSGANEALTFYLEKFGDDFDSIDELYIPPPLRDAFTKQFLTVEECYEVLGIRQIIIKNNVALPIRLKTKIEVLDFVEKPGDIFGLEAPNRRRTESMLPISVVRACAEKHGLGFHPADDIDENLYISQSAALRHMKRRHMAIPFIAELFKNGRIAKKHIRSIDLKRCLLDEFKSKTSFPHWPFIDKDKTTRVDTALLVWFQLNNDRIGIGENEGLWWTPSVVNGSVIDRWLSRCPLSGDPLLFAKTNVRLRDGTYPSLTIHYTRKYHHTEALLAGAHEVFIDELAGRKSGTQSDHYDLRSPHEILMQSIDTFDPDVDFSVVGPVAEQARKIKLVDRKTFLYENAAPKHVTDIGGCSTDWSLEPCKQYGDCTRCDQQVWRKGDMKRLPEIHNRRNYTIAMVSKAETKINISEDPPRPLLLHYQQFKDDLARYDAILAVEADAKIEVGTIVTFAAPSGAMSNSDLTLQLRTQNLSRASKEK